MILECSYFLVRRLNHGDSGTNVMARNLVVWGELGQEFLDCGVHSRLEDAITMQSDLASLIPFLDI